MKGTVIAVWNLKGGTGKTATTINLAYDLSQMGKKVLAVDFDPQTNTTPIFTKANESGHTVRDIMEASCQAARAVYRTKYRNIDIIKGSRSSGEGYRTDILKGALMPLRSRYDAILIDCQPSSSSFTRNALYAADLVLTPAVLDRFCLDNLNSVRDILSELEEERDMEIEWRVFANRVRNLRSQKNIYADIMGKSNYPFLDVCISDRAEVPNSLAMRKPLDRHAKGSVVAGEFRELAQAFRALGEEAAYGEF